ncbi:hypothetical protein [Vibrio fluminensis]|uniref:hypothetical protein n=1 Tax=Vibrio fluminensis TaxID=2783614 RepID=UPI001887CD2B|nr:hypothetical protein [Vibrio fluminensis]
MKKVLVIALSIFSVSAFAAHSFTANVSTEQAIKGFATGAISVGMSAKQIEKAIN